MTSFQNRILSAAKLNADLYEEVEKDRGAMGQALSVVALSSLAAGIGAVGKAGAAGILVGLIGAFVGWFIWAALTYLIGAKLLPEAGTSADMGQLLRTIGFSSSPGLIRIFGIIPGLTEIVFFVSSVWMFAAMVVGVRQALDYASTLRAFGVCLLGWLIQVLILAAAFSLMGRPAL
ncbi:MAG: hypothetical protein A2010_16535 [Nitrospirae bacterium GWD2_57_9]|nr:MAG: hypothetical protein A2010_16535 [Nitrospirae bacterium GWD2_57_9]OGW48454.1 MAG: hypothetical protein A2078_10015 [Nitrospirae bacterium GWC2_57_9]